MAPVTVGPASLPCVHTACRFEAQLTEQPTHALVLCATHAPPPDDPAGVTETPDGESLTNGAFALPVPSAGNT